MASIVVSGDTSGAITIAAPAEAGTNTLTLPTNTGTIITTASSGQSIPKAALPTGSVLQVVTGTRDIVTQTTSTSFVTSNLQASITPTSSSSKIYVIATFEADNEASGRQGFVTLFRNSTNLGNANGMSGFFDSAGRIQIPASVSILDSPNTTSSVTYALYFRTSNASNLVSINANSTKNSIILMEIAA